MFNLHRCVILLLVCTSTLVAQSPLSSPSPATGLLLKDDIVRALIQTSSGDRAHDNVSRLALWDRSQVTEGYAEAAAWMLDQAKKAGLEDAQIERFPSGAAVQYFGNQTEKLWRVRKGELWMVSPFQVRLTTYADLPMSLARNSVSAEIEAELVDVGRGIRDEDYRTDVRGKVVLTESSPGGVYTAAVIKRGAAGIVSSWSVPGFDMLNRLPGDFPDQVGWGRIPEPKEGDTSRPAFLISSRRAQEIKQVLAQGKPVTVRLFVDASLVDGTLDVVNGSIPGSMYPSEEIVVTCHLDHYKPGANDNASGSAAVLEMVRTLNELIASGKLPRPLRTIRFLWVPEYMGTWAWLAKHQSDPVVRLANLNFDMLGENLRLTNARFAVGYTPDFNPSWMNGLMESIVAFLNKYNGDRYPAQKEFHVISVRGTRNRLNATMEPASVGTDHELFNTLRIPGTGPAGWPDDFYHSSEDTPDKTDPTQLHRVIVIGLAAIASIAYADDAHAVSFAQQALDHGQTRIANEAFSASRLVASSTSESIVANARKAWLMIRHVYRRERECVSSASVFARNDRTKRMIQTLASYLDDDERRASREIEERGADRAKELGVSVPVPTQTPADRRIARLVPVRVKGKELVNSNAAARIVKADTTVQLREIGQALSAAIARMRSDGMPELRIMGAVEALACYADGKRSLADIRDEYGSEYTLLSAETIEMFFRMMEKAAVVEIRQN